MGRPCDWSCRDHPPYPPFARGGKGRNEIGMNAQLVQDQLFTSPASPCAGSVVDRVSRRVLMNSVGWTGGFLAPVAVGLGSKYFGLSLAIASTAAVYLVVGLLTLLAAHLAEVQGSSSQS